jgi:hypothetical protein
VSVSSTAAAFAKRSAAAPELLPAPARPCRWNLVRGARISSEATTRQSLFAFNSRFRRPQWWGRRR